MRGPTLARPRGGQQREFGDLRGDRGARGVPRAVAVVAHVRVQLRHRRLGQDVPPGALGGEAAHPGDGIGHALRQRGGPGGITLGVPLHPRQPGEALPILHGPAGMPAQQVPGVRRVPLEPPQRLVVQPDLRALGQQRPHRRRPAPVDVERLELDVHHAVVPRRIPQERRRVHRLVGADGPGHQLVEVVAAHQQVCHPVRAGLGVAQHRLGDHRVAAPHRRHRLARLVRVAGVTARHRHRGHRQPLGDQAHHGGLKPAPHLEDERGEVRPRVPAGLPRVPHEPLGRAEPVQPVLQRIVLEPAPGAARGHPARPRLRRRRIHRVPGIVVEQRIGRRHRVQPTRPGHPHAGPSAGLRAPACDTAAADRAPPAAASP